MVVDKKTQIKILIILTVLSIAFLLISPLQRVKIIYFTNPSCIITHQTDRIIDKIKSDFGNRIQIREVKVSMYEGDPPDTEEIKELREKYRVYGVPVIIINGKEFTKEYTKHNLEEEICRNFIIKPGACR